MRFVLFGILLIVQGLTNGVHGEVNNVVRSKIFFANQDLNEKNVEVIRKSDKPIKSEEEIFVFLKQFVAANELPMLRKLLARMSKRELQHIDFLIFLTSYYKTATKSLLQAIVDILEEDETNYKNLMQNFGPTS